jgi:hypothetical protein
MNPESIVSQFVDLALKHKWDKINDLSVDEVQILFATVSAAGFELKEVVFGKLVGNFRDQDGSKTGATYPINGYCPFKVIDQEGKDYYFATGWLDWVLRRLVLGPIKLGESREQLITVMQAVIERSIPLQPIRLTPEGDYLCEYPPRSRSLGGSEYFIDHTRDSHDLGSCVGVHKYCNGWMDRHGATSSHDAITCRSCHLRVLFPKETKTYGDLRKALTTK